MKLLDVNKLIFSTSLELLSFILSTSYIENSIPLNKLVFGIDLSPILNSEYFLTFFLMSELLKYVFLSKNELK